MQIGGTGSRGIQVSGFHKAGLLQLNGSGMTFQVQRRLCNKHSNRGLASGSIIECCSKVALTRRPWSGVMVIRNLVSFLYLTSNRCVVWISCIMSKDTYLGLLKQSQGLQSDALVLAILTSVDRNT